MPASVFDEQPTQVIPTQEIAEEMQAQEEAAPRRSCSRRFVRPGAGPRERAAARKPEKKTKKKGGPNVVLILLSLVIVAAAAFIVVRNVVPAFQDGILGGGEPKTAEGLTLDRTALDLAEAGTTMALVPTFSPEGATAQLTWTSSKPEVATVDEKGTVTAVAPGTTVITASMENGQKAECTVNCTWSADAPQSGARRDRACGQWSGRPRGDKAHPQRQRHYPGQRGGHPADYGDRRIGGGHLDQQRHQDRHGDCRRHHHRGGPGRATVTAKVGDQTLNCAVRCIW